MTLCALFLRSSSPGGLLLWCLIGFAAGIGFFIYGFRLLQRRRLILDTPFSKVRSAALGMVEVNGLAVGPYTMTAPVTAKPCYYYRTYVWEWRREGKNSKWVKVAAECTHVPFFLDDNTGRLLVDPRGADLDIHRDFQQEFCDSFFTTKEPVPDNVRTFLARHGIATSNKIKVEEYCIKPKNSLFILGTLTENPGLEVAPNPIDDPDGATLISSHGVTVSFSTSLESARTLDAGSFIDRLVANAPPRKVIRLSVQDDPAYSGGTTAQQKVAAALLKAGISNPAAWSAAGAGGAAVQAAKDKSFVNQSSFTPAVSTDSTAAGPNAFDHHPPVVLMKGTNNKTFLISWRSQRDVARSLGWKCTLMIWGGPVLALLSLYVLLSINNLL